MIRCSECGKEYSKNDCMCPMCGCPTEININAIALETTKKENAIDTDSPLLDTDPYFYDAALYIIESGKASIGMMQRAFGIGYNRSLRIMEQLESAGIVEPVDLVNEIKPRNILMDINIFKQLYTAKKFENIQIKPNTIPKYNENTETVDSSTRLDLYNNKFDYMTGQDFELYCAKLLKNNGYEKVQITQSSGDFGADIIAYHNRVKYAIQCKCYSSDIGINAIYQISGGTKYYNANLGVVLTNQHFTKQAMELANRIGVILWDREFLIELVNNCSTP